MRERRPDASHERAHSSAPAAAPSTSGRSSALRQADEIRRASQSESPHVKHAAQFFGVDPLVQRDDLPASSGATAAATRDKVHFPEGVDLESPGTAHAVAHEMAHVAQKKAAPSGEPAPSPSGIEDNADRAAVGCLQGRQVALTADASPAPRFTTTPLPASPRSRALDGAMGRVYRANYQRANTPEQKVSVADDETPYNDTYGAQTFNANQQRWIREVFDLIGIRQLFQAYPELPRLVLHQFATENGGEYSADRRTVAPPRRVDRLGLRDPDERGFKETLVHELVHYFCLRAVTAGANLALPSAMVQLLGRPEDFMGASRRYYYGWGRNARGVFLNLESTLDPGWALNARTEAMRLPLQGFELPQDINRARPEEDLCDSVAAFLLRGVAYRGEKPRRYDLCGRWFGQIDRYLRR